jgi:signal transduction histidine kinase
MAGQHETVTPQRPAGDAVKDAERLRDHILSTLAHELRNPLVPLRAGLSLIRLAGRDTGAIDEHCTIMERQLDRLIGIVDDLRDVTSLAEGTLRLKKVRVNLQTIARGALQACSHVIEVAGHTLVVDLPTEPVFVEADPSRLEQVLTNLLTNAVKFTPHGGTIELSVRVDGSNVCLAVRDNGLGIPSNRLVTIFELFGQVDRSLERGHQGLGFGLRLVKALVVLHGGTVDAQSDGVGKGSCFTIRLPLTVAAEALQPLAPRPSHAEPRRVLLCDDNRDVAHSLARLVRTFGHEIRVAFDGEEHQIADEFRPDVVLRHRLARQNGYDVGASCARGPELIARPSH